MGKGEGKQAVWFLLPVAGFVLLFVLAPSAGTLINSFFKDTGFSQATFAWGENYAFLLRDEAFWGAAKFTLLFIIVSVPIEMALGMVFALVLNTKFKGRALLRACVLLPWAIPITVSTRVWELMYNYHYGLVNWLLGLAGAGEMNFLGSGLGAFIAVVIVDVWKTTPFVAIILLAGLQAIPVELYEAARVDRASAMQAFYLITVPMLKGAIVTAMLFRIIDGIRVFDVVYVLTRGGPGAATTSLSLYAYKYYLSGDFGFGSAISVVLFAIAMVLAVVYIKSLRYEAEGVG